MYVWFEVMYLSSVYGWIIKERGSGRSLGYGFMKIHVCVCGRGVRYVSMCDRYRLTHTSCYHVRAVQAARSGGGGGADAQRLPALREEDQG